MYVLDVDMDFFLSDVCAPAAPHRRPAAAESVPWPEADVRAFLEERCGLSKDYPVPGRVFPTHDGALFFWREQMAAGRLTAPFHLVHADAHSDLGIGRPGPAYVLETVLARPPQSRVQLERYAREGRLDEANYLLFALAFGWVTTLENVRNPRSRPDMPAAIARPDAHNTRAIRLCSTLSRLLPQFDYREPEVPYRALRAGEFSAAARFDLASLAISPRYAPREADFIAEIFREYIREI